MKQLRKITAMILAIVLLCSCTAAFAGIKYSDPEDLGNVQVRPTATPTPIPTEDPEEEPSPEVTPEPSIEPTVEPSVEPGVEPSVEPTIEPTVEPTVEPAEEILALGNADVRIEGDGMSEIFLTIPAGTPLKVLAVEGDWVKVEIDGQIGYIYKDSVQGIEFEEPAQPEGEEAQLPTPKVTIFTSRRSGMSLGEPVYLTSKLENAEGYEIRYQWQCDKGSGWQDVAGANGDSYSFPASAETFGYSWKLLVYYRPAQ